jgi:hypothetical protein
MPLTSQSVVDTTHHFLFTHRHSPTSLSSHGSDHSLELTMMTASSSESRPEPRKLPIMELCNGTDADPTTRPFLPLSATFRASHVQGPPRTQTQSQRALPHSQSLIPPLRTNSRTGNSHASVQEYGRQQEEAQTRAYQAQAQAQSRAPVHRSSQDEYTAKQHYQQQQQRTPVFGNVVPTSAILLRYGGAAFASPPLRAVLGVIGTGGTESIRNSYSFSTHMTFALALIESILTNCYELFCEVCLSSPLPIRDLYARQLISSHCHIHRIPSSYSYYTPPLPPAPQNTLRALRFPAFPPRHSQQYRTRSESK